MFSRIRLSLLPNVDLFQLSLCFFAAEPISSSSSSSSSFLSLDGNEAWGLSGDMNWSKRRELGHLLLSHPDGFAAASSGSECSPVVSALSSQTLGRGNLMDLRVRVEDGDFESWAMSVPSTDVDPRNAAISDQVVATTDTRRHEDIIRACLSSHRPLILCGPPGSGKTMMLSEALNSMPELVLVALNFSSSTSPELLLKAFKQHCELAKTAKHGTVLRPLPSYGPNRRLVIFCDEVNLAAEDKYGTVRVVSFLRQLIEQEGFYPSLGSALGQRGGGAIPKSPPIDVGVSGGPGAGSGGRGSGSGGANNTGWIKLERIQFVAACNPPSDRGRVPLSPRFLRHAALVLVDYPTEDALKQIYSAFNKAMLRATAIVDDELLSFVSPLTDAMVDFWQRNKSRFTTNTAPQYVYSPRELSRWVSVITRAITIFFCSQNGPS